MVPYLQVADVPPWLFPDGLPQSVTPSAIGLRPFDYYKTWIASGGRLGYFLVSFEKLSWMPR